MEPNKYGFRKDQHTIFPPMVFVELTNMCNLKCIHCPYCIISEEKSYRPRHMDLDIFKRIADEVSEYKGVIFRFVCDGEPLMHPNFLEMVQYAKHRKLYPVCFNTNGTLLGEKMSLEVLKCGVEVVEISLDAINKHTYEFIRRGANFEEVMFNVKRFIELRDRLNPKTKIMVSIIDQPEVKDEINEFIDYWKPRVDRVIKRTFTTIGGAMERKKTRFDLAKKRWPCPLLWTRIFVNVDGIIKFCVEDWFDKTTLFDIRNQSIADTWQSLEYNSIRQNHLLGRFEDIPYCKDCFDWSARRWDYDYFYALEQVLK